jgi:hypothetical protein
MNPFLAGVGVAAAVITVVLLWRIEDHIYRVYLELKELNSRP